MWAVLLMKESPRWMGDFTRGLKGEGVFGGFVAQVGFEGA